ncbi:MAG: HAD-IB family phosphatase [Methanobacteriota archaeon]
MTSRYKLAIFDMDDTLLKGRTIHIIGAQKGFRDEVLRLEDSPIVSYQKNREIAKLLRGIPQQEMIQIFRGIPLQDHVTELMKTLKQKKIRTAVVTNCYQFLADDLKNRLGMDYAVANDIRVQNGVITGELILQNTVLKEKFPGCKIHPICKRSVVDFFCEKLGIQPEEIIAVGDGKIDICMLERAGLGVAFHASREVQEHADISTDDLRIILQYVS